MIQFAIIGCGNVARRHALSIARTGSLAAVCDVIPERADGLAATYNARAYYSVDALLENEKEVEIVSICTPNGFHAEHIIKALQAGKNVLTEKPLCLTKAAAWQIIETEKFCRKRLFVIKSARYNPILQELKALLNNNSLGKLYSFHLNCIWNRSDAYYTGWKGKLFPDGGTLYNQFSHYIDVMLWLFGDVAEVRGFKTNAAHQSSIEFEDTGAASFLMQNSMIGSLHWTVNAFEKNSEIALTLVAEKGTLRIGGEYLNEVQYVNMAEPIALSSFSKETLDSHAKLYDHLIRSMETNESFPGAFDGLRTVETIEKIYKATS